MSVVVFFIALTIVLGCAGFVIGGRMALRAPVRCSKSSPPQSLTSAGRSSKVVS